jgi:D-alanine-D-alanine ligase-like ATP-grasp enzyme/methylase of polypeptide subunit release factors
MRVGIIHTVGSPCRCAEAATEGLRALGHEPVLADSEEIEARGYDLARNCDLVIDHTDTFKGRGLFRAFVRQVLESAGGRIVGSDARACLLADNKIAAKERLSASGLPVPPGIVATRKDEEFPSWLKPPLILKPAFEHMSRGIRIAETLPAARLAANDLFDSKKQPILIEAFVPGREIAVSLLDGPEGLETLPILEWIPDESGMGILTESFKLSAPSPNRRDALKAELTAEKTAEINGLAKAAFDSLGLRDYARFDLRLSPGGQPFFLEANVTPSLESQEALALSASWAGLKYPQLIERMLLAAGRRYERELLSQIAEIEIDLPVGNIKMTIPHGVHFPPQSTIELAKILDVKAGDRVLDLGCGSGFLSIASAKFGARYVLATDLDPGSLNTTLVNARRNGVENIIETRGGSWYEAVPLDEKQRKFEVIIATPPQTPGHRPFGPKFGGLDGTQHILHVVDRSSSFLNPNTGRIWILAISLANPKLLIQKLRKQFSEVAILKETDRFFTAEEYNGYEEGLFDHLQSLRAEGRCEFQEIAEGRFVFRNLFICAKGLRG